MGPVIPLRRVVVLVWFSWAITTEWRFRLSNVGLRLRVRTEEKPRPTVIARKHSQRAVGYATSSGPAPGTTADRAEHLMHCQPVWKAHSKLLG